MKSFRFSFMTKLAGFTVLSSVLAASLLVASADGASHTGKTSRESVPKVVESPRGNWQLVWDDEFAGPKGSPPSSKNWTYDLGNNGGWGNNEEEDYTDSTQNAFLTGDGGLVVQALKQSRDGFSYTSARLVSKQSWRYGYIQVDASLPRGGQGIWPAIWLLPTNWTYGGWPESGEIDMLEAINNMSQVHGDLHYGTPSEPDLGVWFPGKITPGFHVYGIKWEPDRIRFYVDGKEYLTFTDQQWTTSVGSLPAPFDQPFHLMINMAMGGNWPGAVAENTPFPQQLTVRWVRVYQRAATYAWPVPGIIQADKSFSRSSDIQIKTTQDVAYDSEVTPAPPSNLSLVLDHKLLFTRASDYATYKLRVSHAGWYVLSLRVKSNGGHLTVRLDNKLLATVKSPRSTAEWETLHARVHLPAGVHSVQLGSAQTPLQLHWLEFLQV